MMLTPLRVKTRDRNKVSKPKVLPAPTQGWYVGQNLAQAPEGTAFFMENAFPQLDYIRARRGAQAFATGMAGTVSTLMPYYNAGASKFFAVCNNKIYDASNPGAVGAAAVSGLSNSSFEYVQFQGLGGSYLVAVNGADAVQRFDGANWNKTYSITGTIASTSTTVSALSSTTGLVAGQTITGTGIPDNTTIVSINSGASTLVMSQAATASTVGLAITVYQSPLVTTTTNAVFSNISIFKNRIYFVEKNSLNVWYLAVNAIGGAATVFPMQGIFRLGGTIIATSTWAIDSTSGIYESFIVLTSEGEVAMYNGSDPSSWTLSGLYKVSKPLGERCLMKAGGDLAIMTEDGIVPMSKVQQLDQIALENVAVTKPIAPAWRQAVLDRIGLTGWQITIWPLETMGIVNLPKKNTGDKSQFVVNARTGAWASYSGWDANCFAVYNDSLYYGSSDGRVMQAEVGGADDGGNYSVTIFPSFSSLDGGPGRKQSIMVRPYLQANVRFTPQITMRVDFDTQLPNAPGAVLPQSDGAKWDTAIWDSDVWPATLINQNNWTTSYGFGSTMAPVLQWTLSSATLTPDMRLTRIDVLFEDATNLIG